MADQQPPYYAIRTRQPADRSSLSSADSTYGSGMGDPAPTATHDTSRVSYHVKHLDAFAQTLQESAKKAFPNTGRGSQRYQKVQVLLLHWKLDDLFVLPELEDLEKCLREDYSFETEIFPIPSENPHLELMLKVGALIKEHESEDTLFVIYYGGHARIDESRQSTWCATRHSGSPWLQWSAIQTLLERSVSDVLILLDSCAGAASATFPNGRSITETISASSWDAIAPDPGRYSFTNALIEVLSEWRLKTFSAAMLHAEILARLKHPRPILINGKHFEARSTPVHFMMTSNHKAPSIEICHTSHGDKLPPSPPPQEPEPPAGPISGRATVEDYPSQPNEDHPHVMISLALEDDQRLDLNAWEQWLSSFPALAKYVTVQGVFKSHSTLLLLSMPVMIWDLLPEDQACSFVAFIRSNNLVATPKEASSNIQSDVEMGQEDNASVFSGTTYTPNDTASLSAPLDPRVHAALHRSFSPAETRELMRGNPACPEGAHGATTDVWRTQLGSSLATGESPSSSSTRLYPEGPPNLPLRPIASTTSFKTLPPGSTSVSETFEGNAIKRRPLLNQAQSSRRAVFDNDQDVPEGPPLAVHVVDRLEDYFKIDPQPNVGMTQYYASHLGIETADVNLWFHHRRQRERVTTNLQSIKLEDKVREPKDGPRLILAGYLNDLLEIFTTSRILFLDLRSPSFFQKSHIHGAVNLRLPLNVLQIISMDMMDRTFTDEQSKRCFSKWRRSPCIVLYDRNVESAWDCPTATTLLAKLRNEGWTGECFVLKGPYREFSLSFAKYISGDGLTQEAKNYLDSVRRQTALTGEEIEQNQRRYNVWLRRLDIEERALNQGHHDASDVKARKAAAEEHQQELQAEFRKGFPDLYRKLRDLQEPATPGEQYWKAPDWKVTDDTFDRQAPLVSHLSVGLEKMREATGAGVAGRTAAASSPRASHSGNRTVDKLGELTLDDFDEIDPREALPQQPGEDVGRPYEGRSAAKDSEGSGVVGNDISRRKGSRGLWKRLKSSSGK